MNKRDNLIDVLKGIGILFVVIAHTIPGKTAQITFCFHMPLFFLLSGFLFRPIQNMKEYLIKKSIQLLLPYSMFLLVLNWKPMLAFITDCWYLDILSATKLMFYGKQVLVTVYGGAYLKQSTGVFWFVTCLFITQQLFNMLVIKFTKRQVIALCLLSYFLSFINQYYLRDFYFPFACNVVLAALPLYSIGYYYKNFRKINVLYLSGIIVILGSGIFFRLEIEYIMKYTYYGYPFVSLLLAVTISLWLKYLSESVSRIPSIGGTLGLVGLSSKMIMFLHLPILYFVRTHFTMGNYFIITIASITVPILFYLLCTSFSISRLLFLGDYNEYEALTNRFRIWLKNMYRAYPHAVK